MEPSFLKYFLIRQFKFFTSTPHISSLFSVVEMAVRSLEDNPVFNAGHGSVFNEAGKIEMDAIIVDGGKSIIF